MSVFGSIMSKVFGTGTAQAAPAPAPAKAQAAASQPVGATPAQAAPTITAAGPQPAAPPAIPVGAPVDVAAVLSDLAKKSRQKLDWQHSIVDLMKLLGLDSSLAARKELARELGYTGKPNGSAEMNIWLQKQVMRKLAENGGKVPADLMD